MLSLPPFLSESRSFPPPPTCLPIDPDCCARPASVTQNHSTSSWSTSTTKYLRSRIIGRVISEKTSIRRLSKPTHPSLIDLVDPGLQLRSCLAFYSERLLYCSLLLGEKGGPVGQRDMMGVLLKVESLQGQGVQMSRQLTKRKINKDLLSSMSCCGGSKS
jgi:hypothetical protein